jgi:hypothetical protein
MTPQSRHRLKLKHEAVNAFAVKKIIERDLKLFFNAPGHLHCEATNP